MCICRKSISGSDWIGSHLPSLSVSYTNPISSGFSSSSSSSSSSSPSQSVSVRFLFWTIRSFPFRILPRISSHFPYMPSSPLRQWWFFVVVSAKTVVSVQTLFGVFYRSGTEVPKLIFGVWLFPYLFLRYFQSRLLWFVILIETSLLGIFRFPLCLFNKNRRISNLYFLLRWLKLRSQLPFFGVRACHHHVISDFSFGVLSDIYRHFRLARC